MKPARLLLWMIASVTFAAAAHAEPERLGLSFGPGTTVTAASGPAARAGIQPGDIVLAVDGIPLEGVETLRPFERMTGTVALLVTRGDETFYIPVVLDDAPPPAVETLSKE